MLVEYFSAAHILSMLAVVVFVGGLYFALKNRSDHVRFVVILVLIGLNIVQHFFKQFVWKNEWGKPFGSINTAYNMCAAMILLSPFAYLCGCRSLKDFWACAGTASGLVPIVLPMRFLGETMFQWEFFRSFTCHALLTASCSLPLLWGEARPRRREIPLYGLYFLAALFLVYANNCVFYLLFEGSTKETLYDDLFAYNPMQIMGPEWYFPQWILRLVPAFLLTAANGHPIPVLWYAHLLYPAIFAVGVLVAPFFDRDMWECFLPRKKRKNRAFPAFLRLCKDRERNRGRARFEKNRSL